MVERLDFSKPPPGYYVSGVETFALEGRVYFGREYSEWHNHTSSNTEALAAAWAHYEARHDPPGLGTVQVCEGRWLVATKPCTAPGADLDGRHNSQVEARAAAWAWYWRRVKLSRALGYEHRWPAALVWSDDACATVERYNAAIQAPHSDPLAIELPEVLRG